MRSLCLMILVVGPSWSAGCAASGHHAASSALQRQHVKAACAMCVFHMPDIDDCLLAVEIDGKHYLVKGRGIDDYGDAHASDGFCHVARDAVATGELRDGQFCASYLELEE